MLHVGDTISVCRRCRTPYGRLRDQVLTFTFLLLYDNMTGTICSLVSYIQCVLHNYLEKVITFSLQLGIRHMNSRFEAYELNFRNPPKDLPNWEHIHLLEGPNVLYNHIPSLTLRCFGRRLLFPHKRKIFQVAGALSSHHPSCVGLNVMVSFI